MSQACMRCAPKLQRVRASEGSNFTGSKAMISTNLKKNPHSNPLYSFWVYHLSFFSIAYDTIQTRPWLFEDQIMLSTG